MSESNINPALEGEPASESVDVSLIDEMLALSPTERLRQNDRMASLAARLRVAFGLDPDPDDRGT